MTAHTITPPYTYTAYGLVISSDMPFPELNAGEGMSDVVIRDGEVPDQLEQADAVGVLYQANAHQFLLKLKNIANYLVQNGNEIIIDRCPDTTSSEVRVFLLGSCLGALLHQRGMLAIHASAIETEKGAVLFCGPSGCGKSTLLSALVERGYPMLADDIVGLVLNDLKEPVVLPGYPQIKLWEDSAEQLGQPTDDLHRVRPQLGKYALPSYNNFSQAEHIPLSAIYVLNPYNDTDIILEPVNDSAKFDAVLHNTYRERFLDGFGLRLPHFRLATATAKAARVTIVKRPTGSFRLRHLVDILIQDFT